MDQEELYREELIRQLEAMRAKLHEKTMQAEEWTAKVGHSLKNLDLESLVAQLGPLLEMAEWALNGLEMEISNKLQMAYLFAKVARLAIRNSLRVLNVALDRIEAGADEIWDEETAFRLVRALREGRQTLNSLVDRFEDLIKRSQAGGSLGSYKMKRTHPLDYHPPHYHGKGKGRKLDKTFETQESIDDREQPYQRMFFSDETASLEPQEVMFFQDQALTEEQLKAYTQPPAAVEMTLTDIYDVIHCRGHWGYLKYGGWPCVSDKAEGRRHVTADDIERAVQFLLFHGYLPMP